MFLRSRPPPPHWGLPFFPNLYTKVSKSWVKPFLAHIFSPTCSLFGDAFNLVVDRFQEGHKPMAAYQRFFPRHSLASGATGWEQPHSCTGSSYRKQQK